MFAKDVVGCFCHGSVKAVDQSVCFGCPDFKGEEWSKLPPIVALKMSAMLGSLSFSNTGSWKAPGLFNVHT